MGRSKSIQLKPWSRGCGRRLMFKRMRVRIPALGTFAPMFLIEKTENKLKGRPGWPILLSIQESTVR